MNRQGLGIITKKKKTGSSEHVRGTWSQILLPSPYNDERTNQESDVSNYSFSFDSLSVHTCTPSVNCKKAGKRHKKKKKNLDT